MNYDICEMRKKLIAKTKYYESVTGATGCVRSVS